MKKLLYPLFAAVTLLLAGCLGDDEPKDIVNTIRLSISEETGITYDLFDSYQEHPIECMRVMSQDWPGEWTTLHFGEIEGFTYERGHQYYLDVQRTILANPPADATNRKYKLVRILEDRLITEPVVPVEKEIKSEADIEYMAGCPVNKYAIDPRFTINSDGGISSSDSQFGATTMSMPYDCKRIYLVDIVAKDDPNFLKMNTVPYMAIYSYVFSPLTDEIRLVRNESSGPMFKDVIPEEEYSKIKETLKSGEEFKYTIILANVEKEGLQKLEFVITKQ